MTVRRNKKQLQHISNINCSWLSLWWIELIVEGPSNNLTLTSYWGRIHKIWLTFLNVSMSIGLPFGNDTKLGHNWLNLLMTKHIAADTTHWNHVTNSGASKFTSSLLSNALFTNTVTMDVILRSKYFKIVRFVKPKLKMCTNMPLQRERYECISTANFRAAIESTFLIIRCTSWIIPIFNSDLRITIIWSFYWFDLG